MSSSRNMVNGWLLNLRMINFVLTTGSILFANLLIAVAWFTCAAPFLLQSAFDDLWILLWYPSEIFGYAINDVVKRYMKNLTSSVSTVTKTDFYLFCYHVWGNSRTISLNTWTVIKLWLVIKVHSVSRSPNFHLVFCRFCSFHRTIVSRGDNRPGFWSLPCFQTSRLY